MADSFSLAEILMKYAPSQGAEPGGLAERERMLRHAYETGRKPWAGVEVAAADFVKHLAERLEASRKRGTLDERLEELELADLYLACACGRGMSTAVELLERQYLTKMRARLARFQQPAAVLEDVCQQVRVHVLVGAAPKIAEYTGQGSLSSWLQVIATRMLLRRVGARQAAPQEEVLDALEAMPAPGRDMEMDLIRRRHQRELRETLREAFAALEDEQRNLLWLRHVDRLTTTQIAPLFGVSQPTIWRKLEQVHQAVYEETKRRLKERLRLSSQEFESLLEDIRSQFELSISQLLREED